MDTHFDNIYAAANGKMWSIFRKVITNDPKILIQIFTTYIRPNYEYASSVFNVSQKKSIETLESLQKLFTRTLYQRNHPQVKYWNIPDYSERLKIYGMQSLQHRRIIADILLAYDMLITHPNDQLDLKFYDGNSSYSIPTRNGGHYTTKTKIHTKTLADLHFSSRTCDLLVKYKINLHEFKNADALRLHLKNLDISDILIY